MGRTSDARERLVESAETLIHEHGFHAVGVSRICDEAGVNKGSFYHFFPSKQELALEVVDAVQSRSRGFMEEVLIGDGPPLERLSAFLRGLYEMQVAKYAESGKQSGCPLGNLALEVSTQDPLMRARLLRAFETQIGYLEGVLREARKNGDLAPELDPREAAETLIALAEGKIMLSKLRDDPESLHDLEAVGFRALGIEPPSP